MDRPARVSWLATSVTPPPLTPAAATPITWAWPHKGRDNATARGIQIRRDDALDEAALLHLLGGVIADNRAGGWRKLQSSD